MSENTPQPVPTPTPTPTATPTAVPVGSPKFWPTFLLCLFLGCFGVHRFYLKSPRRVLMLCTFGGFGLWALADCVTILLGKFKDETGALIPNPKPAVSWTVFGLLVIVGVANNGDQGSSRVWKALNEKTYAADVAEHDATIRVKMKFYDMSNGRSYLSEGTVGSIYLKFFGKQSQFEAEGNSFRITFDAYLIRDGGTQEPLGKVVVSGTYDPKSEGPIGKIHYKEIFETSRGMEYDLTLQ